MKKIHLVFACLTLCVSAVRAQDKKHVLSLEECNIVSPSIYTTQRDTERLQPFKTFKEYPTIKSQKVYYKNMYNIMLCADIYFPQDMDTTRQYAAIIVAHPFGAVKEQCSGLYAQEMARRGFVALAFDASYQGESGGQPRHSISPDALVDDFSASVDYLGTHSFIDRNRIGVIGICGSGGFAVRATSLDPRIRALVTVSMGGRTVSNNTVIDDQRSKLLDEVAEQRWREAEGETPRIRFGTPEILPGNATSVQKMFFDYYRNKQRGYHPGYQGTRFIGQTAQMTFFPLLTVKWISPRPVLFIAGENAHTRSFSEEAYREAEEPKELYIVPYVNHVDLYDKIDKIPFDKICSFFISNFNKEKDE